jgi:hypothetical protein
MVLTCLPRGDHLAVCQSYTKYMLHVAMALMDV